MGFFPLLEKPMARLPDPQLARQWRERLDRFEHSDLTVEKSCEFEGYSTTSFYQWRRKLRDRKPPGDPAFIPVQFDAGELSHSCVKGKAGSDLKRSMTCASTWSTPSEPATGTWT